MSLFACGGMLLVGGCGAGIEGDFCNKVQQCIGGNPQDVSACIAAAQGARAEADAYHCSESYNTYANCYNTKGTCTNLLGIKTFSNQACASEAKALDDCQKAASDTM